MGQVSVSINNHRYTLACRDGEEDRLLGLAKLLDSKVRTLTARLGQVGENKLILMAALLIADEFEETRTELQGIQDGKIPVNESETAGRLAVLLNGMAASIEVLADDLEKA